MLKDVARQRDKRGITIQEVGIKELHLPVRIRQKDGGEARVIANISSAVELPHTQRGTHMSRFVEVLGRWSKHVVSAAEMEQMTRELQEVFQASTARVRMRFRYFLDKQTPVTHLPCQLDYDCEFDARIAGDEFRFVLAAAVPVLTVCPCSKEISDEGAHSQRAVLQAWIETRRGVLVWLEDLIRLLEKQGSYEVFPILKRADEKWVTEQAFANPKFVEDVVRDTVLALRGVDGVVWYRVQCRSYESIHNHEAYALVEGGV